MLILLHHISKIRETDHFSVASSVFPELYMYELTELLLTQIHEGSTCDRSLRGVFRWFGGLFLDIKRKLPHYLSDYTDACNLQCVASFLFLYCACMSPVITFGGLLGEATEGRIVSPSAPAGFRRTQEQRKSFEGNAATLLIPAECH